MPPPNVLLWSPLRTEPSELCHPCSHLQCNTVNTHRTTQQHDKSVFLTLDTKQNFKTVNSPGERAKPTVLYVRERSQRKQYRAVSEQDTATMLQADVFSPPLPSVHAMSRTLLRAGIARTLLRAVPFLPSSLHTLTSARIY